VCGKLSRALESILEGGNPLDAVKPDETLKLALYSNAVSTNLTDSAKVALSVNVRVSTYCGQIANITSWRQGRQVCRGFTENAAPKSLAMITSKFSPGASMTEFHMLTVKPPLPESPPRGFRFPPPDGRCRS
jgi:hypothetical protein